MRKTLLILLVTISLGLLVARVLYDPSVFFASLKQKSGLRVASIPEQAVVKVEGREVGNTPFENQSLEVGEYLVEMTKDGAFWTGKVKLSAGTLAVINRELSSDPTSSAGEVLTLEKGKGVTIVSIPSQAEVEIDGKYFGKTPTSPEIESGDHTFVISHQGYLKRSIRANLPKDYRLTLTVDLALSEPEISLATSSATPATPIVIVKDTPTGFLRVRERGSLLSRELARVKPGDELVLLEEGVSWVRVRLPNGAEGHVSSQYVEKK